MLNVSNIDPWVVSISNGAWESYSFGSSESWNYASSPASGYSSFESKSKIEPWIRFIASGFLEVSSESEDFSSASGASCELGLGAAANIYFWSMLLYIIILNLYRREQHSSILCTLSLEKKNSISNEELRSKRTQACEFFTRLLTVVYLLAGKTVADRNLSTRWQDSSCDFVLFRMGDCLQIQLLSTFAFSLESDKRRELCCVHGQEGWSSLDDKMLGSCSLCLYRGL